MAKFGCLFMILSMVALFAIVVFPVLPFWDDNTTIDSMLQPLLCGSDEEIERELYSSSYRPGETSYSMEVYCIDLENQERDVTGNWMAIGMASFIVPFLGGLFMFIGGVSRAARKMTVTNIGFPVSANTVSLVTSALQSAQSASTGSKSLSDRLKQLQEARDAGLITADEYDRMRQEILDEGI